MTSSRAETLADRAARREARDQAAAKQKRTRRRGKDASGLFAAGLARKAAAAERKQKAPATGHAWWVGLSRTQHAAEVARRFGVS